MVKRVTRHLIQRMTQYNGKKGSQTPNTKNDRQYNDQKGNQTPNTKNDTIQWSKG
jgi:hypothetical protein